LLGKGIQMRPAPGSLRNEIAVMAALLLSTQAMKLPAKEQVAARPAGEGNDAVATDSQDAPRDFELQVVTPEGKPVPQTVVEIRTHPSLSREQIRIGQFVKRKPYGATVKTDDTGRLSMRIAAPSKGLAVHIEQPGFGPYWAAWDGENHRADIPAKFTAQLEHAWTIGAAVVDAEGKPVAGAKVHPSIEFKKRPGDSRQLATGATLITDTKGKWTFASVPDSMNELFFEINHPDFMPLRRTLTRAEFGMKEGQEPTARIALDPGASVRGHVTDESGKPIAGALIRAKFLNDIRQAKTSDDGSYRLAGCEPRMARVVVSAKGRALDMKEVRVEPDMQPVDFVMKPGGTIRLRVVDKSGHAVPKSRIFFQRWRGRIDYFEFDHVNDRADENGVWQWDEAPPDVILADICPPDGMQLTEQRLQAGDDEYVFTALEPLEVYGTVLDAETKQPVKSFQVIPGIRSSDSHIDWVRQANYTASEGKYRIRQGRSYPAHLVRIEADGYRAAVSRDIKSNEGQVQINFELQKGVNVAADILTPDGAPAAAAKIALGVAKSQISVKNGEIDDGQTYAARLESDSAGHFQFAPQDADYYLVITHATGYALVQGEPDQPIPAIKLQPWAKLQGSFHVGKQALANTPITISGNGPSAYGEGIAHIFTQQDVTTGPDGRFSFNRVFGGSGRVGRRIMLLVSDGATEATSSKMVPFECQPGETVDVNVGGDGVTVSGRLMPPKGYKKPVLWNFALIHVEVEIPDLASPPVPAAAQNNPAEYRAWWNKWQFTDEGRTWKEINDANERLRNSSPYFTVTADRDGSFAINDVPPGNYKLNVRFDQHAAGRLQNYRFEAPATDEVDQVFDLGTLTLDP
jgi:uncharacterized GH25 family protein